MGIKGQPVMYILYTDHNDYLHQRVKPINKPLFNPGRSQRSEAKVDANSNGTINNPINEPVHNTPYHTGMQYLVNTTEGYNYYYLTFKPFNKAYEKSFDWYNNRMIDSIYKRFKQGSTYLFITKETQASKIHCNLLIESNLNLLQMDGKNLFNKVKIHAQLVESGLYNRRNVVNYMTKEFTTRPFNNYKDYLYKYHSV